MNVSMEVIGLAVINVVALIVAYVKTMGELAYVKGQMTHFLRQVDHVDGLARDVDLLDRAQIKAGMDIDQAFEKIRGIQDDMEFADTEP